MLHLLRGFVRKSSEKTKKLNADIKIGRNVKSRNKQKVFVIGANKTGTTSLDAYFKAAGYITSPQRRFELLRDDYFRGKRLKIYRLIRCYETFQDIPFSIADADFLIGLTSRYPSAKFILTTRSSDHEWYSSLCRFHSQLFYQGKWPVNWEDVKSVDYISTGWNYRFFLHVLGSEECPPYDEKKWLDFYNSYNQKCRDFFEDSENFLEINLQQSNAAEILSKFLGTPKIDVPHLNKTK